MVHIVEVIIGHTSTMLPPGERKDNYTHRWTLYVKPGNRDYEDFPDNKLIQKVCFQLHDTFPEPERWVNRPPFRITETGFAGFTAFVTIQLNIPNEKPRTIEYELDLLNCQDNANEKLQKLAIRSDNLKPECVELIRMYAGSKRRKASMVSSSNDEKSPHEKSEREKHYQQKRLLTPVREDVEREKDREKRKKSKKEGSSNEQSDRKREKEKEKKHTEHREKEHREKEHREKDHREKDHREKDHREEKHREKDHREKEHREKKIPEQPKSAEELTKKLNECEDPRVIYRAGQYLLEHLPDTQLDMKSQNLTYDLTKGSTEDLLEIERILKKAVKQNS